MRGRPPTGPSLVDHLDAPRMARDRLRIVLETLTGRLSIAAACRRLGVQRTRLLALRRQALHGALEALTPRPVGRPPRTRVPAAPEVARLQARITELELALQAAVVRTEVALTMPFLLTRGARGKKGARRSSPARAPRARGARRRPESMC